MAVLRLGRKGQFVNLSVANRVAELDLLVGLSLKYIR